jgi:predicted  nucleic acid-binding Zn-ribbon protein
VLKRNDLVKQFELITKQEIKNYQDQYNAVLQQIRDIKISIDAVQNQHLEKYALLHSAQGDILKQIQEIKQKCDSRADKLSRIESDQSFVNHQNCGIFTQINQAIVRKQEDQSFFHNKIDKIWEEIHKLNDNSKNTNKIIDENSSSITKKLTMSIEQAKQEIKSAPSEYDKLKTEMNAKLMSAVVDSAGLLREISVIKKENIIFEKKIENLYTLIKRINKKAGDK